MPDLLLAYSIPGIPTCHCILGCRDIITHKISSSVLPGMNNVGFKLSFINSSTPPLSSTVYVSGV